MRWISAMLALCAVISAQAGHIRQNFDGDWKFRKGDDPEWKVSAFDDSDWRALHLPHDWSIEGEYSESHPMGDQCGYLPAGIAWYRKTIDVDPAWKGQHVEIVFDGVFMNSTVWANGRKLGTRPYGWISFAYDISDAVQNEDSITFAVRVDNEKQPSARWYTGSGIYAHTWLDVMDKVHVVRDGVFVRTQGETVKLDVEVENTLDRIQPIELDVSIVDPVGNEVAQGSTSLTADPAAVQVSSFTFQVPKPLRWNIDSPRLYQAITKVKVAGTTVDTLQTRFGIRDIEWKPESGMWLNGKNIKLRGICNHQDAGALGAAVPDKILKYRIQQLKDMGVNCFRTAHNPQTPKFYELCDEMGMLVMDEIFDGWERKAYEDYGARFFDDWWERDLTDWIRRDRNHPSIVLYSVGNETHGDVAPELVAKCHELDPTRPVTSGHSNHEDMDIAGFNGHSEKMGWWDEFEAMNKENPRVFIGTENTHTWQVRGFYRTKTWFRDGFPNEKQRPYPCPDLTDEEIFTYDWIPDGDRSSGKQIFNSSYDNAMVRLTARKNIEQLRDIPYYAGSFRWTGHDYIGEAGYVHGGWPFKAFMGGAIDLANFEKDLFYLYQSQWTEKPMIHILPHWTHPNMKEGTRIPVQVYSNCDEVELFFNGESLGMQKPGRKWDEMQCQWMVPWKPGTLRAEGFRKGNKVAQKIIRTADTPARISLSIDGDPLKATGRDLVQVRVTTTDEKGEFYPYGENRTWFSVIGNGRIKALDNGSPVDVEPHFGTDNRRAFYGLTRAYIEAVDDGNMSLLAACILGEKKLKFSNKVSIDTDLLSLRGPLPEIKKEIFYTTDGRQPTPESMPYTGAFEVKPGTTVKALVVIDGNPLLTLEERFADDEGFIWEGGGQQTSTPGVQAETADFNGASVETWGEYYRGKGYLKFGKNDEAYVEWYQENDGGAGPADLAIRYGGRIKNAKGHTVKLIINGVLVNDQLLLPNTRRIGKEWATIKVPVEIGRGANTIRIEPRNAGLLIDEILIR
ncbi:glycoside hydrolase family 2 TIM barrel-domain containing protein [Pontiella agarivorans]|uniref:Glycoside hydrolase family 2 TIM barrel-domain containing protein n=1 Tax=Pontiella agarivorans TaxID=3038953 RepID=A0ABU5MTT1_9BACT|nr:glycoside hydrolase family 2 TIM barrel-domain containing protein [Pontiella agarivorans]MDZ8117623.1 glycoside hydrolase family 2 TIM barrel-domain containing protein [Pontiella agarivorans]